MLLLMSASINQLIVYERNTALLRGKLSYSFRSSTSMTGMKPNALVTWMGSLNNSNDF